MGYIKHHAVLITSSYHHEKVEAVLEEWKQEFPDHQRLLVGPTNGVANSYRTWVLAPDGSKEGWAPSDLGDLSRDWLMEHLCARASADVVEVAYGGDQYKCPTVQTNLQGRTE